MPTYRRTLSVSFFTKFCHQIIKELNIQTESKGNLKIDVDEIERKISTILHDFGELTDGNDPFIGKNEPNVNGLKQTTGVAKYVDDIPKQAGELFAGVVLSSKPHAILLKVDPSKALSLEGVHAYVDYKDLKHISYRIITKDDEFFASKEVNFVGQLVGLIIADSKSLARKAASLVQIDYEPLLYVLTIEDAIENNSFFTFDKAITKGEFDSNTLKIDENDDNAILLEGKLRVGGQEQFYLETHGCLAIPKNEDNEMQTFSST
jgi:xanthine dehydrogenase/oxidase